ncbi:hypothetical protein [Streptomyces halobius]|uniref:Uncharacterized protein n=1 Tax=Streptomyces halobius TaxID=2879846 RepID=A0ABY4M1N0_9ACTN|nr:hypothetical protein [Streptomyces halobius]UQA91093.1 hypothetical protein K9S39_03625 [Streptomyces halobius]
MTTRPLARVGVLAGALLAASVGFSGLAQAHTPAAPAERGMDMTSQMRAMAADMHAEARHLKMPRDAASVRSAVARHECKAACAVHRALDRGKKCCACCGQGASTQTAGRKACCAASHGTPARTAKHGKCCAASHAVRAASARNGSSTECCGKHT